VHGGWREDLIDQALIGPLQHNGCQLSPKRGTGESTLPVVSDGLALQCQLRRALALTCP